jgi:hypothetical protein
MGLLPRALRPVVLIRRKAIYGGFLGGSGFWKVVGVIVFGKSTIKKFFGKNPEIIDVSRLGGGRFMQITTAKPLSRRARRKQIKAGVVPASLKESRALGKLWAHSQTKS